MQTPMQQYQYESKLEIPLHNNCNLIVAPYRNVMLCYAL